MDAVTRWVVRERHRTVRPLEDRGQVHDRGRQRFAVQSHRAGLRRHGPGELERQGLPADALVLEITETCVISDFERSRQVIQELRDIGIVVSIDDFGAGVTSLAYLSSLPVRELKLDRYFVARLAGGEAERDLELLRSTIELGHAMGLRIVAEGIEDEETLDS